MKFETRSYTLSILRILLVVTCFQVFLASAAAQKVEVEIEVDAKSRSAKVSGRFVESPSVKGTNLVFKSQVAGHPSLAARIGPVALADPLGNRIGVRKLMDGEYVAAAEYLFWKYEVDLTPPKDRAGYAHASWVDDTTGMLMLDDLLPQFAAKNARLPGSVRLKLPDGWTSQSSDQELPIDHLPNSIIFIGKGHRVIDAKSSTGDLRLILKGQWLFTDDEAVQMAREIFDEYSKLLGTLPSKRYVIALQRFPTQEQPGQWEAETRGRTVTIFSSDMPFRTQSIQRLHEQLRHEIFHLWFPNGIDLIGDYAWFYEGFAMYTSLKLAVKLNRIRFEDFLDTLSRAHTIDTNAKPRKALNDASIDPTVRYARGMMLAFLTDLKTLRNSGGKNDVERSLRTLFVGRPRPPHGVNASEALKAVVTDPTVIERYVNGAEFVDWKSELAAAGIESRQTGRTTTLTLAPKLNGGQREILDRLGYNNWRKVSTKK